MKTDNSISKILTSNENKIRVLKTIDYQRLSDKRSKKKNYGSTPSYTLIELQNFARELGGVSNSKKKKEIINYIKKLFEEFQL